MRKLLFALIIVSSVIFAGSSIIILPFTSVNLDNSTVQVVDELFRSELSKAGYEVTMDTSTCTEIVCAGEIARQKHTSLALFGSLIGMGEKIVVTVYFVRSDDEIVYTDRFTAEYIEDLDAVVKRLTDGFLTGKTVKSSATTDNITSTEFYEPRRRQEFYTLGSRIGFYFPLYGSKADVSSLFGYEIVGMYETDQWLVELMSGYHGSDENEYFIPIDLTVFRLLSKNDFCPYISLGTGVHLLSQKTTSIDTNIYYYDDDTTYYETTDYEHYELPILSAGGGMLLFRTYTFHVTVDARGWFSVTKPWYHGVNLTFGLTKRATSGKIGCCWGF
ncbi:hypothetical protein J7L68_09060 [bacterium]|nr:hypothetical protein [bacterium]